MAAKKKSPKKAQERNLTRELSLLLAKTLLPDLQARAQEPSVARALAAQYESERKHTADSLAEWTTRTLEQVAVAWILSCVFIRTLEDRGYLTHPRLAGEGAADSEHLFFDLFPSLTQRDYLLAVFRELSHLPGGEEVLAPKHNPAWRLAPTTEAVRTLLAFFREADSEGKLVWSFAGESTRFLGDLYQDVSEAVRERYALLQTPEFVEEFILDLTLDPAIAEFGLEEVRLIDPTCGSGHFLLGAFKRLFDARQRKAPAVAAKEHAGAALAQVYGADINPYAAGIARFRLVLAYLKAAGIVRLKDAPRISTNVVVADSLLFAADNQTLPFAAMAEDATAWGDRHWQFEEPREAQRIFSKRFHAVVGNPPYITCKDSVLREEYRRAYASAAGKYALSAPFTERFFQLAIETGFVGMINANSFMKREFGKALIEKVLPQFELTRVMDTAGAFIPGHGTPTVLLFGRHRAALGDKVVAVLGKRGEPATPAEPQNGLVWSSIRDHFGEPAFENEYVSVAEVSRGTFEKHPWSMGGGGAAELKELLEKKAEKRLAEIVDDIGFASFTGLDDLFIQPAGTLERYGVPRALTRPMVIGENLRDWSTSADQEALTPYDLDTQSAIALQTGESWGRFMWPYRACAEGVASFGGKTRKEEGQNWWEWYRWQADRYRAPLRITFAFVATHNHFVLDRGGKVFNRSAPIIKLTEAATEAEHLALLAYLNSSVAAFYLRQAGHNKGAQGVNEGLKSEAWEQFLEYSGKLVGSVPVPPGWQSLVDLGRAATDLAQQRLDLLPEALTVEQLTDAPFLDSNREKAEVLFANLVAVQEKIDWAVYTLWGLVDEVPAIPAELHAGSRIFEIGLAARGEPTRWFSSNKYALPIADTGCIPKAAASAELLEQPEYKRRWTLIDFAASSRSAATSKALTLFEEALAKRQSPARLADIRATIEQRSLTALMNLVGLTYNPELEERKLLLASSVPFLATMRLTDTGYAKRELWEKVWMNQRREDCGEKRDIHVPPKYDSKDFRDPTYWRLRGKLDVPNERFISYPGAEKDDDKSPLFGWAGWDHLRKPLTRGLIASRAPDRQIVAHVRNSNRRPSSETRTT